MKRRSFTNEEVAQARAMPLAGAVEQLGLYVAVDREFTPMKDQATQRWHVSVATGVVELLVTGEKWFDSRAGKGGGGAIDLTMHLLRLTFVQAVRRLNGSPDDQDAEASSR